MSTKKILGLDLGTNSIGWALIDNEEKRILGMGSRIIPMSQDILGDFDKGNSISQTAERTRLRSSRRLRERYLLRRERLHRVLYVLGFLPEHYASEIDFDQRLGKLKEGAEPKIAYQKIRNEIKGINQYAFFFKESFEEMLEDFKKQPHLLNRQNKKGESAKVPYDWTIYYLRKKALSKKIEREELAWILLNFNQKRGYYQLRGEEEEENPNKLVEYHSLKVVEVIADETQKGKPDIWYSLTLENGWVYRRSSKTPLFDWKDKIRDFIVTTDLNDDGSIKTDKDEQEKRSFRAPGENDWTLLKKKTEQEIDQSHKTVGIYIYDSLLQNPHQKIRGKLVRTIERKFYKEELKQILQKQIEFHPELQSDDLYNNCVRELYRNNDTHQQLLSEKNFEHLFLNDIIFYQRPLRSQKSSVSNCTLESRCYKDQNGVEQIRYLKAIPKSNPYYQEFRIWQWMYNLSIYKKDDDSNVTTDFLKTTEDYENLFDFLNNRKEVDHTDILKYLLTPSGLKGKALSSEIAKYRWNYVYDSEKDESKKYPCNETRALIQSRLEKVEYSPSDFLTREIEQKLWHIIYSVTDKTEYEKALKSFALKHQVNETSFVESFKKFPPFKSEYGSYSEKAIKKLLPLMRVGRFWSEDDIAKHASVYLQNIKSVLAKLEERDKGITDEDREHWNKSINTRLKEELVGYLDGDASSFQKVRLHIASYLVYGRHSEAATAGKWNSVDDLKEYLKTFKQHDLRNPIVEQVVLETLRVVKDIWEKYGGGAKDFFGEIHIELGREMKNTAEDRKRITNQVTENENTNLRIKVLLAELKDNSDGKLSVDDVRPYSPMQQEALKIFEEGVLNSDIEIPEDISKISKTAQPTTAELQLYKLWLEQKYRSPYTGEMIPLSKLFTTEYEIEHIIPQSRYFDDSLSNKVICETAVNKLKDNQLGMEFIKNHHGQTVECGTGKIVKVFEVNAYEDFVKKHYGKNRSKRSKLLMEEIPEKMIERQMNDTRYISKFISNVLSNIVRAENNDDGINSKNLIPGNGKITTRLKQDWGLNDVWNDLIIPRFERMNQITNSSAFTAWNENHQKFLPTVPIEFSKNFSKKRIDHRHHAPDALVIACATSEHVNLLNNQSAKSENKRYDLQKNLRRKELYFNEKENKQKEAFKEFNKPWESFTVDARNALENIVVSFKQNLRVINKATNHYEKWVEKNGIKVKETVKQEGINWAIRKPMHKDTVSGLIQLRKKKTVSLNSALDNITDIVNKAFRKEIQTLQNKGLDKKAIGKHFKDANNQWNGMDISKVDTYYWERDLAASRVALNDSFDEKRIETITDTGIQKILLNHLNNYTGKLDERGKEMPAQTLAFSPEGIEEMNKNIVALNNGKQHQPILKVRTYEPKGNKFAIGQKGNKKDKYVETAKGTNLFFAVYQDGTGKRNYDTIPLNIVIERQKQGLPSVPDTNEKGDRLLFHLSPNDLVYLPTEEENITEIDLKTLTKEKVNRIYKVVSFTGNQVFFVLHNIAAVIVNKAEFSPLNKMERAIDSNMIKETCVKLKVDRLGNISKVEK